MMRHDPDHQRHGAHRLLGVRLATVLALVAALLLPAPAGSPVGASGTVGVIVSPVDDANTPSISADGRWVVFGGTIEGRRTVFRTDLENQVTTEISPVPANVPSGDTIRARLSADGCVVVAISEIAFDLFRDDDRRDRWDVYRLVTPECGGQPNAWELVSMGRTGTSLDGVFTESAPAVSGSGAIVAYVHQLDGATEGVGTITVVDITVPLNQPGREQTVAGMPAEAPNRAYMYRGAREPVLSENGRHLAFVTDTTASAALPGWSGGPVPGEEATAQVYVWDRLAPDQRRSVHLMSGQQGVPAAFGAHSPAISEDGRIIAFVSADRTLVPAELPVCSSTCPTQIYRFDRDTDRNGVFDEPSRIEPLTIVSAVDAGDVAIGVPVAGNASSWAPALNADGSQVAFVTDATNLLPSRRGGGGGPDDGDLLVAEVQLGALRRVLDGADAVNVAGAHGNPTLSRTGQVIAFDTMATGPLTGRASSARSIATVEVTPQLSLSQLDFGTVLLNLDSAEFYVQVQNAGPAAFEPAVVRATSNFRVTGGTCAKGILVAAGSSCSVNVTFRPTAIRGYSGTLTIAGVDDDGPSVSSTMFGAAGDPVLLAEPGGIDLADGVVGGTGGRVAIDVVNIWFVPTRVASIRVTGAHPDDFEIVTEACTGRALNPDASCAIEVQFTPTAPGYRSALVEAKTAVGEYTTAVVGGFAEYSPSFSVSAATVSPGELLDVSVEGFPANTTVRIGFDDGSARFAALDTIDSGTGIGTVQIPSRTQAGEHRLVASAGETAVATATVEVTNDRRVLMPGLPGFGLG